LQNILQNYTHTNQELAHPLGASFHEIVGIYHFEYGKWFAEAELALSKRIRYNNSTSGENIFRPNDPIILLVNIENKISTLYWKFEAGHNFNLKTKMQMYFGIYSRSLRNISNSLGNQSELYYTLGLRMNLNNFYYDI
jgi:hypothetical protein